MTMTKFDKFICGILMVVAFCLVALVIIHYSQDVGLLPYPLVHY